ncbi:MAG: hypothetical protein R3B57_09430 [Phycisphaerales bacterium]
MRERRRQILVSILQSASLHSQEEVVDALSEHGIEVTQATVSRDLAALGVLKGPGGYRLPGAEVATGGVGAEQELLAALREHVVGVTAADALVVVRTPPGHADLLGVALDRSPPQGVVGTIAGDDTLFIATPSRAAAARLAARIGKLLTDEGTDQEDVA